MMLRTFFFLITTTVGFLGASLYAAEPATPSTAVVNFSTCITDSKYGKYEQEQMEKIRQQWSSLMEETDKELKALSEKFEDQDYMDGLSPEAEQEMKMKQKALSEDMMKYQSQLYQVMQQANYFFMQKIAMYISKASEGIAKEKNYSLILNREIAFYADPNMDVTKIVIHEMDKNFEEDMKKRQEEQKKQPQEPVNK